MDFNLDLSVGEETHLDTQSVIAHLSEFLEENEEINAINRIKIEELIEQLKNE